MEYIAMCLGACTAHDNVLLEFTTHFVICHHFTFFDSFRFKNCLLGYNLI